MKTDLSPPSSIIDDDEWEAGRVDMDLMEGQCEPCSCFHVHDIDLTRCIDIGDMTEEEWQVC